jgi:hypothetical protein
MSCGSEGGGSSSGSIVQSGSGDRTHLPETPDEPILIGLLLIPALPAITFLALAVSFAAVFLTVGLLCAVIVVPAAVLLGLVMIPIGPELAVCAIFFDVTVEASPPGRWLICQVPADPAADVALATDKLMHSVTYADPEALAAMSDWMQQVCYTCI